MKITMILELCILFSCNIGGCGDAEHENKNSVHYKFSEQKEQERKVHKTKLISVWERFEHK
jgi:hypothetical protein